MRALVVYDSTYGNTENVARAVADGLGGHHCVRLLRVGFAQASDLSTIDLLVLGGPTQRRHAGDRLQAFLDRLPRCSLTGLSAAAFDTRYRVSMFLAGSAAVDAVRVMRRAGHAWSTSHRASSSCPTRRCVGTRAGTSWRGWRWARSRGRGGGPPGLAMCWRRNRWAW